VAAAGLGSSAMAFDPQSFHLMQIERVVGGAAGDTSAQAIQLRMRFIGQNFTSLGKLMAYDAGGKNPIVLMDCKTNVLNGELGDRVLFVTEAMKNYTDPPVEGDFTLTNPIPDSYLAAGKISWEDNSGFQILWIVCAGGANYTGSTKGAITNDDDGDFGPPFASSFPTDGAGLVFQGGAADQSHSNATDYALTDAPPVLTNNDGAAFQVVLPPPVCYPDCDGDGVLSFFDFLCYTNAFNANDPYADCDGDGELTFFDFLCYTNLFNAGDPYADCDNSGELDFFDFLCYTNLFNAGC
jgi:hypothetical protein